MECRPVLRCTQRNLLACRQHNRTAVQCVNWLVPPAWTRLPHEMFEPSFRDRSEAGEQLGQDLLHKLPELQHHADDLVVLGLVRGGMPVADAVAHAIQCPHCDAFVVRKIGAPLQPEFGIGAIAEGGHVIVNEAAVEGVGATQQELQYIIDSETRELQRRVNVYRGGQPHIPVTGKTVVVIDDGLATGVTARAACEALRASGAAHVVLAVPVGAAHTVAELEQQQVADVVVCLRTPARFRAVGAHYQDFSQTTDEEVVSILQRHPHHHTPSSCQEEPAAAAVTAAPQEPAATAAAVAAASPAPEQHVLQHKATQGDQVSSRTHKPAAAAAPSSSSADSHRGAPDKQTHPDSVAAARAAEEVAQSDTAGMRDQAPHRSHPAGATAAAALSHMSSLASALGHLSNEAAASAPPAAQAAAAARLRQVTDEQIVITDGDTGVQLHGSLTVPQNALGLVVFAHGSGSSRNSPRNRQVATTLNQAGLATLLFDLLSPQEAQHRHNVFDINLLASRLQLAVECMEAQGAPAAGRLPPDFPLGFFGASTGGGAALWAAAYLGPRVSAVVVRGGRPDLAAAKLPAVTAPTLLVVGGEDGHVLELNEVALQMIGSSDSSQMVVVPGAGHLFEGQGRLEVVADAAVRFFTQHMGGGALGDE